MEVLIKNTEVQSFHNSYLEYFSSSIYELFKMHMLRQQHLER